MLNKLSLSLLIFFISCAPIKNGENRNKESKAPWNKGAIVTAANPHAVEAAIEILNKGGSAVDAAIAAHLVLGLVEPQSSGLGGGGFMLLFVPPQHQHVVREKLTNLLHVPFNFENTGSQVIFYDRDQDYSATEADNKSRQLTKFRELDKLEVTVKETAVFA